MNLLGAKLYDPAGAVSKSTASLLAMTAFDTANLRLTVTVPSHGNVLIHIRCTITGATTCPQILLGTLVSATVTGRQAPLYAPVTAPAATEDFTADAWFTVPGLAAGSTVFDAAYAVQVVVASTNIKYGGPNDATGNDAWGGLLFEIWDPAPFSSTLAEPGQGLPPSTDTLLNKIGYLYKAWLNKSTQTGAAYNLYNSAGAVVDQKATTSDDNTTFTRNNIASGP